MANFCLTVLEGSAKGQQRSAAAKKYRIQREVLTRLSDLAADKGGPRHARKAKGLRADYTNQERAWIEATVKAMIRRAAEIAHDPSAARRRITMGDLPPL